VFIVASGRLHVTDRLLSTHCTGWIDVEPVTRGIAPADGALVR
jgi:hypothetical protein